MRWAISRWHPPSLKRYISLFLQSSLLWSYIVLQQPSNSHCFSPLSPLLCHYACLSYFLFPLSAKNEMRGSWTTFLFDELRHSTLQCLLKSLMDPQYTRRAHTPIETKHWSAWVYYVFPHLRIAYFYAMYFFKKKFSDIKFFWCWI